MPPTKKHPQNTEKIKLIVEIAVAVISVMSLFFAWQANQISKKTIQPQVLVLDTFPIEFETWANGNLETAVCRTLVRLANVGGVDTDLFTASVKADTGTTSSVVPMSEIITSIRTETLEEDVLFFASIWRPSPDDTRDPAVIWKDGLYYDLPISLKSHTTSNVYVDTYFWYVLDKYDFHTISLTPVDEAFSPVGYKPINVSFIFQFPDESTITTNPTQCAYFK
ncbi:MAG TPA: hypothetical protein PLT08_17820 [Anaerolineales bacterium]|nr:hypothetical protein [Anaerolineales bacterium]